MEQEKEKPLWVEARYFPSFTHLRFSLIYVACTFTVFVSMLITKHPNLTYHTFLSCLCWTFLFLVDFRISVKSASIFLLIKYQKKVNPVGEKLSILGALLFIANIVTVCISLYLPLHYDFNLFLIIHICIYLAISLPLEYIYFDITRQFIFHRDSSVCAGIYGFLDGFVRPVFRGVYCVVKYAVAVSVLIVVIMDYVTDSYNVDFFQYALPALLQLWYISLFLTSKKNRPSAPKCIDVSCWRPFVERYWRSAAKNYNARNKAPLTRRVQWKDAAQVKKDMKALEDRENARKMARRAKIKKSISAQKAGAYQHAAMKDKTSNGVESDAEMAQSSMSEIDVINQHTAKVDIFGVNKDEQPPKNNEVERIKVDDHEHDND
eukprot:CAMPEP_0197030884 /NCGR_PEP_ID=MMETSP1384-20130603/10021_1 /TAXON_ID=29189 /ORGANISM="Ammonia sp." /LENGTH=376 /DNA_ID=CAMNT_0042460315 /DNA_START=154 /DNA_END=1284 /DNA_ORIENTATION=+